MKKRKTNYELFKEAYDVYHRFAYFSARKHGMANAITIVNKFTGVNHYWVTGFKELIVNDADFIKITQNYEIQ